MKSQSILRHALSVKSVWELSETKFLFMVLVEHLKGNMNAQSARKCLRTLIILSITWRCSIIRISDYKQVRCVSVIIVIYLSALSKRIKYLDIKYLWIETITTKKKVLLLNMRYKISQVQKRSLHFSILPRESTPSMKSLWDIISWINYQKMLDWDLSLNAFPFLPLALTTKDLHQGMLLLL